MQQLATFFLYAILVDGVLSVMDLLSRNHALGGGPNFLAVTASLVVLLLSLGLFTTMVFTPRLPRRLILPPILFLAFTLVWDVIFGTGDQLLFSVAESLLALGLLVGYRKPEGSGLHPFAQDRPALSLRHFLVTAPLHLAIAGVVGGLLVLGLAQRLRVRLEDSLDRYVTVQSDGISLEERTFRRGEKEIRLVSMIHVAKNGFYDDVAKALPAGSHAVVLLEGISDRGHQMDENLDYSKFADWLGMSSQKESSFARKAAKGMAQTRAAESEANPAEALEYRNGDIDLEELSPGTIRWIRAFAYVLDSRSIGEALQKYKASKQTLEADTEAVYADILEKRNRHLLGEMRKTLESHQVIIVPWGAKHMPGLQKAIQEWGFVETGRARRQALQFQNKALISFISLMNRLPSGG